MKRQPLDIHVQRVGTYPVDDEMATDVAHIEVRQGQTVGRSRGIEHVVTHRSVTNHERIDLYGRPARRGWLLGLQRVYQELEVGLAMGSGPVERGMQPEHLSRSDDDVLFGEFPKVCLHRQARGRQHLLTLPVANLDIIDHYSVQEADVDAPHRDLGSQSPRQHIGHFGGDELLYKGQMQKKDKRKVDTHTCPYNRIGYVFDPSQFVECLLFNDGKITFFLS